MVDKGVTAVSIVNLDLQNFEGTSRGHDHSSFFLIPRARTVANTRSSFSLLTFIPRAKATTCWRSYVLSTLEPTSDALKRSSMRS